MGHVIGIDTTYTGNPVSFNAAHGGTMKSVSVPFSPTQDLHGYANPWPGGGGKNKCSMADQTFVQFLEVEIDEIPAGTYKYSAVVTSSDTDATQCAIIFLDADKNTLSSKRIDRSVGGSRVSIEFTVASPIKYVRLYASTGYPSGAGDTATFADNMICLASATDPTVYAPYSNICPISGLTGLSVYVSPTQDPDDATVYNVDWSTQAGTVYGGTVDVVTGVLTVDMGNIPSYNGETINEPWLSSMDAYAAGTTPTIGAQVVYTLATPITYQLTPKQITALIGQNYIWSSNNETLNTVLTAPATGFAGWLIKCVTNGVPVEIPLKYMRAETYTVTPDQRMEWSAERDVTGVLHRETVQNLPPKIEFNTPLMTNSDINALHSIINAAFTNYLQRNITIQFYDPERNEYWEWDCYMPDVKYHIRNADTVNNIINYEELRYAFIGY